MFFDTMVSQIYPSELQLDKAYTSCTEAAFLDLLSSLLARRWVKLQTL